MKKFAILLSLFILSLSLSLLLSRSLYNSIKCVRVCHHAPLTSKAYFFLVLCRKIFSEPFDFIWILGSVRSISRNICLLRCCKNAKKNILRLANVDFKAGYAWTPIIIALFCIVTMGWASQIFTSIGQYQLFKNLSLKTREWDESRDNAKRWKRRLVFNQIEIK